MTAILEAFPLPGQTPPGQGEYRRLPHTLEAFAETPELDIVIILGEGTDRFKNVQTRPQVSLLVTHRYGEVPKFQIRRLSGRGVAREVKKDSAES